MGKLTAAQMTQDLPLAVEPNRPRRLTRREQLLLCRLIDVALCVDELPFDTSECGRIVEIREKLRPIRRRRAGAAIGKPAAAAGPGEARPVC